MQDSPFKSEHKIMIAVSVIFFLWLYSDILSGNF